MKVILLAGAVVVAFTAGYACRTTTSSSVAAGRGAGLVNGASNFIFPMALAASDEFLAKKFKVVCTSSYGDNVSRDLGDLSRAHCVPGTLVLTSSVSTSGMRVVGCCMAPD